MTTASAARSVTGFVVADVERNAGALTDLLRRARGTYRAYRATLAELSGLTDRQLADLGIARAELREVARRAAHGN